MDDYSISPEREAQLIDEMLHERVGIDASLLRPIIALAAIGLVNSRWRNSRVEDWHARGRISDGEMLRINSHATWRIRQLLARWLADVALSANGPVSDLDRVRTTDVDYLAARLYRWLINPRRK